MMLSDSTVAAFLRFAFIYELIDVSDIVMWADQRILALLTEDISNQLVNLSLSKSRGTLSVFDALGSLIESAPEAVEFLQVIHLVLALINKRHLQEHLSYVRISDLMYALSQKFPVEVTLHYPYFFHIDEDYRWFDEVNARQKMDEALASHSLPEMLDF